MILYQLDGGDKVMRSEASKEKWKKRNKVCQERHRIKLRYDALYMCSEGTMKCVVCGNENVKELCIKHIGGGGWAYRERIGVVGGESGTKLYRWLRDNGYPKEFRTVCRKCSFKHLTIAKLTRQEAKNLGISDRVYYRARGKLRQKTSVGGGGINRRIGNGGGGNGRRGGTSGNSETID